MFATDFFTLMPLIPGGAIEGRGNGRTFRLVYKTVDTRNAQGLAECTTIRP